MSSLLNQAIVDASALKNAAIKNAEAAIIEKYSSDIKSAVETLLEQDELGGLGEEPLGGDEFFASDGPEVQIPPSVEDLGLAADIPGQEKEWVVSFEDLKDMAERLAGDVGEEDLTGDPLSHETAADTVLPMGSETPSVSMTLALEEDQELDISDLDDLLEELIVDINPQKEGWAATPDNIMDFKERLKLAQLAGEKAHKETEEIKNAAERLAEEKNNLLSKNKKLVQAFRSLKEKFEIINLSNARLIYTNRVLTNNSLNERQKTKIVESLSQADSIEETKLIFETLQGAVGSIPNRKQPQSLREAIHRPTGTSLRREPRQVDDPEVVRLQALAGIKNK